MRIKELVEKIQYEAYLNIGSDPNELEQQYAQRALHYQSLFSTSPALKRHWELCGGVPEGFYEQLINEVKSGKCTKYQDPFTYEFLRVAWDYISKAQDYIETDSGSYTKIVDVPIIATAPTGNFNAHAIADPWGNKAILFEDEIVNWSHSLCYCILSILGEDIEESFLLGNVEEEYLESKKLSLQVLGNLLLSFVVRGYPDERIDTDDIADQYIKTGIIRASNLASLGQVMFLVGHEYGHIQRKHHERLNKGPYSIKNTLCETYSKFVNLYRSRFPSITENEIAEKVLRQSIEFEADYDGYISVEATMFVIPLLQRELEVHMLSIIGLTSFFIGLEYLEKVIRTLLTGSDGSNDTLLSTDYDVQDIVLRTTHPSPLSRLNALKAVSADLSKDFGYNVGGLDIVSDNVEKVFKIFWDIYYEQIKEFHKLGVRPHKKWNHMFSEVGCTHEMTI